MSISELADSAAKEIVTSLGGGEDDTKNASQIIEKALISVMKDMRSQYVDVVNVCCSADQDLAHKISRELQNKETALIANLSSMR